MIKFANKNFNTPINLVTFLSCHYATILNIKKVRGELKANNNNNASRLFAQKGLEHERHYLDTLKKDGRNIIEISKDLSFEKRIIQTNNAIKKGIEIIYQGVLYNKLWRGNADFLIKCNTASRLGNYSYEVLDTKLSKKAEVKHIIQLCMYSDLLNPIQGNVAKKIHLYLGNNQQYSFNIIDYIYYYNYTKEKFLKFIKSNHHNLYPEPCYHCRVCEWKNYCTEKWKKDDHLSLVANITNAQRKKLNKCDISTIEELARTEKKIMIPNLNREVFLRLRDQAILQHYKAITGKNKYHIISQSKGKGFERMPRIDQGDLFFDMEGDPFYPEGLEYLFGIYYKEDSRAIFKAYWAHDHREEKQSFIQFIDFLKSHFAKYPDAYIYHYNHYEITSLKRLSCKYTVCEEQLDNLLRQKRFIDLYIVIRESVRISEPGYSIKNLEVFYMNKRDDNVSTAVESIITYNKWRETKKKELLKEIASYNEVDCISTYLLRNWLVTLKPKESYWFKATENDKNINKVEKQEKHSEKQYNEYKKKLENILLTDEKKNLLHLLEFHNREAKIQWWNVFDRQNKYESELIEDTDCLGGLEIIAKPYKKNRSFIYFYKYPEQDTKLKKGSRVFDTETMKWIGDIIDINKTDRYVKIRRSIANDKLPHKLSVGPGGPVNSNLLRSAMYRVADRMIQKENINNCISDLLTRSIPRIKGKNPGDAIITSHNLYNELMKAISNMNNSYLFIQGPPGTGKTYISSHVIVNLMKEGKKIGITSNSHKVIHNLLSRIESVAQEQKFSFLGVKKVSSNNKETYFYGLFTTNETKCENISLKSNLFAGTAWLFAHEHFSERLDYLFIDEAGQVPLANVIAMATSTYNLILIGDQMQLSQPIKGVHPEGAGLSVLDYLLGDQSTIPVEKGIFLSQTRRLRHSICQFISESFYDCRLITHRDTLNKTLTLKNCNLPNEGIKFIDAKHEGCYQKSVEEGNIIYNLYNQLLGQKIQENKTTRKITRNDILVMSPYNVQVNYLRSLLSKNAKVGTIDIFQGQEAPLVIISMVTSNEECLPKNIEFLYSKNRLNVAISRAECLAIIVANPRLLEVPCKTIDQMRMVNTLCKVYSVSNNNFNYRK